MKLWRAYSFNPVAYRGDIISSLEEWLREKLKDLPSGAISLETNLGGLDEAGTFSPDLDWAGMVAAEFPDKRVEARYLPPQGFEEEKAPYFVRLMRKGQGILKAEVHAKRPGIWAIYEDSSA
ncbi:MAG: hypothetical protein ACE5I9_01710 [Candidatus Methylomirabilales bacterium]